MNFRVAVKTVLLSSFNANIIGEVTVPPRISYKYGKKDEEKPNFAESIISAMLDPKDGISQLILNKKLQEAKKV